MPCATSDKMPPFVVLAAAVGLIFAASAADAERVDKFLMKPQSKCKIRDVFIEPCPEALENKICELPQHSNASITFKYTSEFGSEVPKTRLYAETPIFDMPFMDMDTNACLYTQCPMVAGVERTWDYRLYVSEAYPKGGYTVKLKYWDDGFNATHPLSCAFTIQMKIV